MVIITIIKDVYTLNRILRNTRNRQVILEELKKLDTHPTADDIYERVRSRLPHISLGTVYRNLEILVECGLIQKLELGSTQRRFDANTRNHYHIRCIRCGKVEDVSVEPDFVIDETLQKVSEYKIIGYRLEFIGVCPQCQMSGRR